MEPRILKFGNPRLLSRLYCGRMENLAKVEEAFEVKITAREDWLQVDGALTEQEHVAQLFEFLNSACGQGLNISASGLRQHARRL